MDSTGTVIVNNVINEILHGVPRTNSVSVLLAQRERLELLMSTASSHQTWSVSDRELLSNCFEAVIGLLRNDEFETRIGAPIAEARAFCRRLIASLG